MQRLSRPLSPLDHVLVLSDDVGIIQHAVESVPNRSTGYCTDDVSRAFIVALMRLGLDPHHPYAERLASSYLAFLHDAQLEDGRFHNFLAYDRAWLDAIGTHDSCGRAMWALGYGMRYAPTPQWRRVCRMLLDRGLRSLDWLEFARSESYAALGLAHAVAVDPSPRYHAALTHLAARIEERYRRMSEPEWAWFEDRMTYDNARLPEALLRAGRVLDEPQFVEAGLSALAFYERIVIEDGIFVPIGSDGWYPRGGVRARFAQQPLEAAAMIDAELAAFAVTGERERSVAAETALAWYYGRNSVGVTMAQGGGCFDGFDAASVNRNMGAESTLAHLAGAYALAEHRAAALRSIAH